MCLCLPQLIQQQQQRRNKRRVLLVILLSGVVRGGMETVGFGVS
jgi:hypothetical protein